MSEGFSETGPADSAIPAADLGRPGRVLAAAVGVMILAMMVVTSVDVTGRYFFNTPLLGAFEATEILMGIVVFAGMPLTTAAREHITVNFLENRLSLRARRIQAAIGDVVCAGVAIVMGWRVALRGLGLIEVHETTLILGVGRGYIALAMAAMIAVTAMVFLYSAWCAAKAASRA